VYFYKKFLIKNKVANKAIEIVILIGNFLTEDQYNEILIKNIRKFAEDLDDENSRCVVCYVFFIYNFIQKLIVKLIEQKYEKYNNFYTEIFLLLSNDCSIKVKKIIAEIFPKIIKFCANENCVKIMKIYEKYLLSEKSIFVRKIAAENFAEFYKNVENTEIRKNLEKIFFEIINEKNCTIKEIANKLLPEIIGKFSENYENLFINFIKNTQENFDKNYFIKLSENLNEIIAKYKEKLEIFEIYKKLWELSYCQQILSSKIYEFSKFLSLPNLQNIIFPIFFEKIQGKPSLIIIELLRNSANLIKLLPDNEKTVILNKFIDLIIIKIYENSGKYWRIRAVILLILADFIKIVSDRKKILEFYMRFFTDNVQEIRKLAVLEFQRFIKEFLGNEEFYKNIAENLYENLGKNINYQFRLIFYKICENLKDNLKMQLFLEKYYIKLREFEKNKSILFYFNNSVKINFSPKIAINSPIKKQNSIISDFAWITEEEAGKMDIMKIKEEIEKEKKEQSEQKIELTKIKIDELDK